MHGVHYLFPLEPTEALERALRLPELLRHCAGEPVYLGLLVRLVCVEVHLYST